MPRLPEKRVRNPRTNTMPTTRAEAQKEAFQELVYFASGLDELAEDVERSGPQLSFDEWISIRNAVFDIGSRAYHSDSMHIIRNILNAKEGAGEQAAYFRAAHAKRGDRQDGGTTG